MPFFIARLFVDRFVSPRQPDLNVRLTTLRIVRFHAVSKSHRPQPPQTHRRVKTALLRIVPGTLLLCAVLLNSRKEVLEWQFEAPKQTLQALWDVAR